MIKKSVRTETRQVEDVEYTCDLCGKEAIGSRYRNALQECCICGKEVCRDCRIGFDSFGYKGYSGDRPYHRACKNCWDSPYRQQIVDVREKADEAVRVILYNWRGKTC